MVHNIKHEVVVVGEGETHLFRAIPTGSKLCLVIEEKVGSTHTECPENKQIGDPWCAAWLHQVEQHCKRHTHTHTVNIILCTVH